MSIPLFAGPARGLDLTRYLLGFNTINPPGNEAACIEAVAAILEAGGLSVASYSFAAGRPSLVATLPGPDPVCFTGHVDVVPLGERPWDMDPFAGEISGDQLFGRGTSDMKSGVAAMMLAALDMAARPRKRGVTLVITAGEERGCQGALHLASLPGVLGEARAVVVGEPTGNYPYVGHKGLLWLEFEARGVTAHSSMPEAGDNAIYKMARALMALEAYPLGEEAHPVLGKPTLNVGMCSGGLNVNSVPSSARFTVDCRTLPDCDHGALSAALHKVAGKNLRMTTLQDARGFVSDPEHPFVRSVFALAARHLSKAVVPRGVPYYTDGAALCRAYGNVPTLILGPGELEMAHKRNEFVHISKIAQATALYTEIMAGSPETP